MRKTLIFVLLIVAVAIGSLVYYNTNYKPQHKQVESSYSNYRFKAVDLFNQYESNEQRSDSLYLNKIIQVEGEVYEVDRDQKGERILVLKENDDMYGVICTMDESDSDNKRKAESVKPKDHIVLKGVCAGFDMEVKLNDCIILNIGGPLREMKTNEDNGL